MYELQDYFSAWKGGKEQPYKAGRENTLDGGEEDFSGSPLWRPAGIVWIVTAKYFRSKIIPWRSQGRMAVEHRVKEAEMQHTGDVR